MKIGFVFECGPEGADKKVCLHLAARLAERCGVDLQCESATLDNKPRLIEECGITSTVLLAKGCDKVLIVWDLYPAWREHGGKPCLKQDREAIYASIQAQNVAATRVHLVCIHEELEAWLLADGNAINSWLSTKERECKAARHLSNPDIVKNPKAALQDHFSRNGQRGYGKYVDRNHAVKIAELIDIKRIRKSASFRRFEAKLF